jgi:chromosome segregation ATPase
MNIATIGGWLTDALNIEDQPEDDTIEYVSALEKRNKYLEKEIKTIRNNQRNLNKRSDSFEASNNIYMAAVKNQEALVKILETKLDGLTSENSKLQADVRRLAAREQECFTENRNLIIKNKGLQLLIDEAREVDPETIASLEKVTHMDFLKMKRDISRLRQQILNIEANPIV